MQQAFNQGGQLRKDWMEDLIGVDDLEDRLQQGTILKIQAMLNKEWVLAHLTDAEAHDARFWLDVMRIKILGEHPPEESAIRGPLRAYLFDEQMEGLWPLTAAERNTINQLIETLKARVTRGRGGFERKQMNTSYAAALRDRGEKEEKGRLRGLIGGR